LYNEKSADNNRGKLNTLIFYRSRTWETIIFPREFYKDGSSMLNSQFALSLNWLVRE